MNGLEYLAAIAFGVILAGFIQILIDWAENDD